MPKFTKLTDEQIQKISEKKEKKVSQRQIVRKQYKEYLQGFQPGEWVSVTLEEGEKKANVQARLKSIAKELGWVLAFKRSSGSITFEIKTP